MNWLGEYVIRRTPQSHSVLNLGCGILQEHGKEQILFRHYLAVDAFPTYLEKITDRVPTLIGVLPDICASFVDKSYDTVLLLDVIEHLTKPAALVTLKEAERIARCQVLVCTPEGFVPQDAFAAWDLPDCPYQAHLCGFTVDELKALGYTCEFHKNYSCQAGEMMAILAQKIV